MASEVQRLLTRDVSADRAPHPYSDLSARIEEIVVDNLSFDLPGYQSFTAQDLRRVIDDISQKLAVILPTGDAAIQKIRDRKLTREFCHQIAGDHSREIDFDVTTGKGIVNTRLTKLYFDGAKILRSPPPRGKRNSISLAGNENGSLPAILGIDRMPSLEQITQVVQKALLTINV